MELLEMATRISIADASELSVDALVGKVENGEEFIVVRDDKPIAVVVSGERFEEWQRLQDDLTDITLVAARMLTDDGKRYSLDEVLEQFGYTREELADEPETHRDDPPPAETSAKAQGGFRSVDRESHPLIGRWRIVEMDLWDRDYLDLVAPAHIAFTPRGTGEFAFGAVTAWLDCGYSPSSIDFTWEGSDEGDHVHGDGWAEMQDDRTVRGEIRFHYGDESEFKAERWRIWAKNNPGT